MKQGHKASQSMLTSDQIVAAVLKKKKPFFDKRGEVTIVKRSPKKLKLDVASPLANVATGISVK